MAGGKLTPRQRMINMMYLVLTAMLALNVSAEVLEAFVKIDQGLQQTSEIAKAKNEQSLGAFAKAAIENKEKVKKWQEKALLVDEKSKELYKYIQDLKIELVKKGDGEKAPSIVDGKVLPELIEAKDNTDAVNALMIGANANGKAYELKKKVEGYRDFITTEIVTEKDAPGLVSELKGLLNFDFKKKNPADGRTWETFTFEGMPLMSAVAMLSKMQVDIQNSESSVYDHLFRQIDASSLKFTNVTAVVKPVTSSAIIRGSEFEAHVFLGAYDPNQKFTATLNGGKFESDSEGKITIKRRGDGIGMQTIQGSINFKGPDGDMNIPVKFEYQVVETNLVVSPDKMNVFYLGIANPVSISVAGVPMDKINVSITNAKFEKRDKGYVVTPEGLGTCNVSVTANVNGVTQNMGPVTFRVKRVPKPTAMVHGISARSVAKSELAASQGVVAQMPPDFDFDLKFTVKSFTVGASSGGYVSEESSASNQFNDKQRKLMSNARANESVYITNIKAVGPDGATVDLNDIVLKIK